MAVKAKLRYLRISPRKVRLVADLVRGLDVDEAEVYFKHLEKRAAVPLLKLLRSAIASAQHNFNLDKGSLFISELRVDGGPTLKRYRARALGRAAEIRKRTSHVILALEERRAPLAKKRRFVVREIRKPEETSTLAELEQDTKKTSAAGETPQRAPRTDKRIGVRRHLTDFGKKFFRRKSV